MTILGPDGKPAPAKTVTEVHITILHRPVGMSATKNIKILAAQVDGDFHTARVVLQGALTQTLNTLISLKVIASPISPAHGPN